MARIKFLDVLEETKQKPGARYKEEALQDLKYSKITEPRSTKENEDFRSESVREYRSSTSFAGERRIPRSFSSRKSTYQKEDQASAKPIWIAALILFLSALFFFGGYWAARIQQGVNKQKMDFPTDYQVPMTEAISPETPIIPLMDTAPVNAEPAKKPIPIIKPLTPEVKNTPAKATPKKSTTIGQGEYVIQVAAFSSLENARAYEKKLLEAFNIQGKGKAGDSVYISENYMGDNKIFRVRVRNGYRSANEARSDFSLIKSVLPQDAADPRIIPLDK